MKVHRLSASVHGYNIYPSEKMLSKKSDLNEAMTLRRLQLFLDVVYFLSKLITIFLMTLRLLGEWLAFARQYGESPENN